MTLIERLPEKLKGRPDIQWSETGGTIRVEPASEGGFSVELTVEGQAITVSFADGWHQTFSDTAEAVNCVEFGLSDRCRLRVFRRGGMPYHWTVEYREGGRWVTDSTTALLVFPFWRSKEVVYLQNRFITSDDEESRDTGNI